MRLPRRTAFVTPVAPPHDSGQAIVIGRLLEGFDPDTWEVLSTLRPEEEVPGLPLLARKPRRIPRLPLRFHPWAALLVRTFHVAAALLRVRARAVVGMSGRLLELPSAWLAARLLRLPFFAWCVDDWLLQSVLDPGRRLAAALEPRILRSARAVMVSCPLLAEDLERRHGVRPVWVPNPWYDGPAAPSNGRPHRLVFTGQVYAAHLDALQNTLRALDLLDRPGLRLDVFSGWVAPGALEGPRVEVHEHRPFAGIARVHEEADVLLLALAFRSPYPELIRASCPTKLSDYLRSGRPILVHAPEGSFTARYCRERGCGLVVDRDDPAALAEALARLLDDPELAGRLAARARECAAEFAPERSRKTMLEVLSR